MCHGLCVCFLAVCIPTGIVFEIVRHTSNFELFRGFVFFFIAIVLLIPSGESLMRKSGPTQNPWTCLDSSKA